MNGEQRGKEKKNEWKGRNRTSVTEVTIDAARQREKENTLTTRRNLLLEAEERRGEAERNNRSR